MCTQFTHTHMYGQGHTCMDRRTHAKPIPSGQNKTVWQLVSAFTLFGGRISFSATVLCCSKLAGHKRAANYPVPASILPKIHCRYRHRHGPARLPFNVDSQDTNSGHRVVFQPTELSLWPNKKDAVPVGHSSAQQSS